MQRGSMLDLPHPQTGKPQQYETFALLRNRNKHFREATCEEARCEAFLNGFVLSIDTSTPMGQKRWHYVTHDKSRSYTYQRVGPTLYKFVYGPGNDGFAHKHLLPTSMPPKAVVMPGDWRMQTGEARVHTRLEDWVDQNMEHKDRIATIRQRG